MHEQLAELSGSCSTHNEILNVTDKPWDDRPCLADDSSTNTCNCSESVSSKNPNKVNFFPKARGFKMVLLNIVSLPKHIDEIRMLLVDQPIDLIAFNETRLDPSIADGQVKICGYEIIRKDRSRRGGGVRIFLRSSINYRNRADLIPSDLEGVCLEIIKPNSRPFVVASVYRPPDSSSKFFESFEYLIKAVDDEKKELHILGDLNGDMLKNPPDQPTKSLKSIYELYQLSQLIKEATRITNTSSSLLDHYLTTAPEKITLSGVLHTGISDHSFIFGIRKICTPHKAQPKITEVRNMKDLMNRCL